MTKTKKCKSCGCSLNGKRYREGDTVSMKACLRYRCRSCVLGLAGKDRVALTGRSD